MSNLTRVIGAVFCAAIVITLSGCCGVSTKSGETKLAIAPTPQAPRLQFRIGAEAGDTTSPSDEMIDTSTNPNMPIRVLRPVLLDESALASAGLTKTEQDSPAISITFTEAGRQTFSKITAENVGRPLVIVLDGKLLTAPRINSPITGGKGIITMKSGTPESEVKQVAETISSLIKK